MSNAIGRFRRLLLVLSGLAIAPLAQADWELNLPVGVTEITREVYGLHMLIFWVCVAIGVVVFGAMIWSIIYHRASRNPTPATFSHSTTAEIIWTIIPIIILVAMAYPSARTLVKIEDSGDADMSVQVTGFQWKWHYNYIEDGVDFYSSLASSSNAARQVGSGIDPYSIDSYLLDVDNRLVVPVNTKVRLFLTASDVIHAWWVPELTGKRDAVPGFTNTLWFRAEETGLFRGQCAELCGRDHGFMPIVVEVLEKDEYAAWMRKEQAARGIVPKSDEGRLAEDQPATEAGNGPIAAVR